MGVSASRDKTIKLWNTLAQCKYTIQDEGHSDWVSCVRFSPNNANPIIVSCGRDRYIKVWDLESKNLVEDDLRPEIPGSARTMPPQVTSLAWSADGQTLFAGYTDNAIRVWQVSMAGSR